MNIQTTRLPVAKRTAPPAPKADSHTDQDCKEAGPGLLQQTFDVLSTGAKNTLNEGMLAAKNDPALTMRIAATSLSDQILKKVDQPIQNGFNKTIVPVMRVALLGGNVVRAHNTFSNPLSSKLDRTIDAVVVATDAIGAIGGIAMLASDRFAGVGETLMGFSYAVDAVSHAYRGLNHAGKRIEAWQGA